MLLCTFGYADAKLPKFDDPFSDIHPEHVGHYHNEAILLLGEKYSDVKGKTHDFASVMNDLDDIMASYCASESCIESARQSTLLVNPLSILTVEEATATHDDLDPRVKQYLQSFESAIHLLDTESRDTVITEIMKVQDDVRANTDLNDKDKYLALAAGSVALESTRLWTDVQANSQHPLKTLKQGMEPIGDRHLQELDVSINIGGILLTVLSDVIFLILFLGLPFPAIIASFLIYSFVEIEVYESPSMIPSLTTFPSNSPTVTPTRKPSTSPSARPTSKPSIFPSVSPSRSPKPSTTPSKSPKPSTTPSNSPSVNPSGKPLGIA